MRSKTVHQAAMAKAFESGEMKGEGTITFGRSYFELEAQYGRKLIDTKKTTKPERRANEGKDRQG